MSKVKLELLLDMINAILDEQQQLNIVKHMALCECGDKETIKEVIEFLGLNKTLDSDPKFKSFLYDTKKEFLQNEKRVPKKRQKSVDN